MSESSEAEETLPKKDQVKAPRRKTQDVPEPTVPEPESPPAVVPSPAPVRGVLFNSLQFSQQVGVKGIVYHIPPKGRTRTVFDKSDVGELPKGVRFVEWRGKV